MTPKCMAFLKVALGGGLRLERGKGPVYVHTRTYTAHLLLTVEYTAAVSHLSYFYLEVNSLLLKVP